MNDLIKKLSVEHAQVLAAAIIALPLAFAMGIVEITYSGRLRGVDFWPLAVLGLGCAIYWAVLVIRRAINGPQKRPPDSQFSDLEMLQWGECAEQLKAKWLIYVKAFHFKPEVKLADIIHAFSVPAFQFAETAYPDLIKRNPVFFWKAFFTGIKDSGTHTADQVDAAFREIDAKLRNGS